MASYTITITNCIPDNSALSVNACDTITFSSGDANPPGRSYSLTGNIVSQNVFRGVQGPIAVPAGGTAGPYTVIGAKNNYTYNINGNPNCGAQPSDPPEIIIAN